MTQTKGYDFFPVCSDADQNIRDSLTCVNPKILVVINFSDRFE